MITATVDRHRTYVPHGGARKLFLCRDPQVMIDGPAGTGKSRAVLEKINAAAMKYDGMRACITRKTRESMTQSTLVTFEEKVLPEDSPVLKGSHGRPGPSRHARKSYVYPNGSEIVVAGWDRPEKILSTEYDLIAFFQAEEMSVHEWETADSRLRNGMMPYQQMIADCNPGPPRHWLLTACKEGRITRIKSTHSDNPTLKASYIERLKRLTGVRHKRLYLGEWAAAEGLIYDTFDRAVHVKERRGKFNRLHLYCYPGYGEAAAILAVRIDDHDRAHIAAEWYELHQTYDDISGAALGLQKRFGPPEAVTLPPTASHLADTFRCEGLPARLSTETKTDVSGSIGLVRARLGRTVKGRPALTVSEFCPRFIDEIEAYQNKSDTAGRYLDDVPLDEFNRAMEALRHGISHLDGPRPALPFRRRS